MPFKDFITAWIITLHLLLGLVLEGQCEDVPADDDELVDLLRDGVHDVVEVVHLKLAAALGRFACAALPELLKHLRLLHDLLSQPVQVLAPDLHAVLRLPVLCTQTKEI